MFPADDRDGLLVIPVYDLGVIILIPMHLMCIGYEFLLSFFPWHITKLVKSVRLAMRKVLVYSAMARFAKCYGVPLERLF